MRSARRLMAEHPELADYISVSLHCELADILTAYTKIVEREGRLTGKFRGSASEAIVNASRSASLGKRPVNVASRLRCCSSCFSRGGRVA